MKCPNLMVHDSTQLKSWTIIYPDTLLFRSLVVSTAMLYFNKSTKVQLKNIYIIMELIGLNKFTFAGSANI